MQALLGKQVEDHAAKLVIKDTGEFQALAIAPAPCRSAATALRPYTGLDGTHTKSRFRMMLLIATGIDANGQILILAWALVLSENTKWWTWFCKFLYEWFPSLQSENHVFVSDREKGIFEGLNTAFPNSYQAMCCQYLADNVQLRYGIIARGQFWKMARARTEPCYKAALNELQALSPTAVEYLSTIDVKRWARYAFPYPRYGHDTSNISESLNSVLRPIRLLPPIHMIDAIWTYIMETRHERRHRPQRGVLANTPLSHFEERVKASARY